MKRPQIKIKLVDRLGKCGCHHGHKVGDVFDYDTQRGEICPMAAHVAFPYVEILRYGGTVPVSKAGDIRFCCPDVDVINVFSLEVVKQDEEKNKFTFFTVRTCGRMWLLLEKTAGQKQGIS